MFTIEEVQPLFTGVITTATKYKGDQFAEKGGLIVDTTRLDGTINPYQWVVSCGPMAAGLKKGDIVKINFKRYAKPQHLPGDIDRSRNVQSDNLTMTYEIPMIEINGVPHLFLQNNDIEYVVTKYSGIEEGGLLQ